MLKRMMAAACASALASIASASAPGLTPAGPVESGAATPKHVLTVISAFSCGFCRILDSQGSDEIRTKWIPMGLRVESVPVVISPTDVATTIAANCGDPAGYLRRVTILFRTQSSILGDWNSADRAQKDAATSVPNGGGADRIARLAGLYGDASTIGLTAPKLKACLTDAPRQRYPAAMDRMATAKWQVRGTPTVLLDGRPIKNTWPEVRIALAQAFANK